MGAELLDWPCVGPGPIYSMTTFLGCRNHGQNFGAWRLVAPLAAGNSEINANGRLRAINPSPYAGLFAFPEFALVSCSPELLLRVRGRRDGPSPPGHGLAGRSGFRQGNPISVDY